MYSTILVVSYLFLLISGIVYMSYMRIRSNRNFFYYTLSWFSIALSMLILTRLLEVMFINNELLTLFNQIALILLAIIIPLSINVFYALVMKKLLPFIIQMISGAAALSLILFFLPFVSTITNYFRTDFSNLGFLVYLWMPAIIAVLFIPIITLSIKMCFINISSLSIDRVLNGSPDLYFYIDKYGKITDDNAPESVWGKCKDRAELLLAIEKYSAIRRQDGWPKLRQALLLPENRVTGEIRLQNDDRELWYEWTVKPIKGYRGKILGSFLLLSDRTAVKMYLNKLHQQNEDLQQVNNELADYEALVDRYTELAARQEVADYIDISVRYRILQSFDHVRSLKSQVGGTELFSLAIEHLRAECKRALTDVRALVKRLAQ